jgi:hypothetical protein
VDKSRLLAAALLMSHAMAAHAFCDAPQLSLPAPNEVTGTQLRLAWTRVPHASAYRVRLQSRVPDGRVLAAHDTVVKSPEFLPPRPIAEHRAKVTVRLSAICGSETSAESVSSFVIDTSPTCKLGGLEATLDAGKASVKWPALAGARSYEVRAYRLADGRLLASQQTREAALELALGEPAVVSVRPACAAGLGEAIYRVVAGG